MCTLYVLYCFSQYHFCGVGYSAIACIISPSFNSVIGFSFGGLLAKAVAARMWREPLLSVESLQENVACITLGAPMITLPVVTMAMEEAPQFGSTVHSIMLDSDPIPKFCMFLDPRCEEVGSEVLLPSLRNSLEVTKLLVHNNNYYGAFLQNFQGSFTSDLICNFGIFQESDNSKVC